VRGWPPIVRANSSSRTRSRSDRCSTISSGLHFPGAIGRPALGMITSHHYSAAHPSPENKAYVDGFMKANNGMRPNFMSVGGYDGTHLIYEALKKTGGATDGEKLVEAMKGMAWTSPRGPMSIDPATRDVVQNVYIRKCELVDGKPYNVEFDKVENFKDPGV